MSGSESPTRKDAPRLAFDAILAGDSGHLLRHAMWLDAANRAWRAHLPAHLRGHLRLGNFNNGCLWALADTPAWAERARLDSDLLLNAAIASGLSVAQVKIRVAKQQPAPRQHLEKPPTAASVAAVKDALTILQRGKTDI